ncbi:sigma 54-interacting transcriptional regulator [Alteromonas sp. KUL49]|uniref:sigma 54-interacting transcriptional regulator n=1 Tax=Alteromonas sp. KUL49 TaxID=2480798 RepID=UPI00102F03F3|nr:sigma 54-interacting transcriptional regulator [Alteromonas sp. KUL49]TAP38657.1 AAA family ATPase [Alteromonas sp. KUL49]GEA12602.1 sigma-54-dependent Fis family transcriptional regulator [Alteromonas sp. KUL49]
MDIKDVNKATTDNSALKILIFGYNEFSQLMSSVLSSFDGDAQFKIVDAIVGSSHEIQGHIEDFSPDVVVSAGSNARYLQSALPIPVVPLITTEWDIFHALEKASQVTDEVHFISFSEAHCTSHIAQEKLGVTITESVYLTAEQAREQFYLASQRENIAIVGASLVCGLANSRNIPSFMIYSEQSCRDTIKEAIQQGKAWRKQEKDQALLSWLLMQSQTPIIMVDEKGDSLTLNNAAREHLNLSSRAEIDLDALIHPIGEKRETDGECEINGNEWWFHLDTIDHGQGFKPMYVYQLYRKKVKQSLPTATHKSDKHELVYVSKAIENVTQQVKAYASSPSNVLLFGESGTGKELVARQIHKQSPYADGKFVALNCSAIPSELFEGELFGHQDGAYTGSKRGGRKGLIEEAQNGALFLDEISELALDQQAKLLRFLQERSFRPLGGNQEKDVDLKLIAASNRSLSEMAASGEFREDLFYRLNVFNITVPPLRERPEDIKHIAIFKLKKLIQRYKVEISVHDLFNSIERYLNGHRWPGNIRELENVLERIVAYLHTVDDIERLPHMLHQITPELFSAPTQTQSYRGEGQLKTQEEELILAAINKWQGDKHKAAQELGISHTTLWRRLKTIRQK